MRQGKRATKQMTPVSSPPLSQVCLSCQHTPLLSLYLSLLQCSLNLLSTSIFGWLQYTHTQPFFLFFFTTVRQGQVVKGRVKGTYAPPAHHLSVKAPQNIQVHTLGSKNRLDTLKTLVPIQYHIVCFLSAFSRHILLPFLM